ncbi:MAG TPA: hypothetical protein ENH84_04000 [Phycisphaerae bacterium]|nr:hypothetical protein [Phycisphaerae bacterium]
MEDYPWRRKPPSEITEPKLLLAEGNDAYWFCRKACGVFGLTGFQVIDFGGKKELGTKLKTLKEISGFEQNAEVVVVISDADTLASGESDSVQNALKKAKFTAPKKPFEVAEGNPRTAFILFPGLDESGKLIQSGTLEDLCLATIENKTLLECVDSYLSCCKKAGSRIRRLHKHKLHAYLSGRDKFVGMDIAEASRANAWNWNHPRMKPFKDLLTSL